MVPGECALEFNRTLSWAYTTNGGSRKLRLKDLPRVKMAIGICYDGHYFHGSFRGSCYHGRFRGKMDGTRFRGSCGSLNGRFHGSIQMREAVSALTSTCSDGSAVSFHGSSHGSRSFHGSLHGGRSFHGSIHVSSFHGRNPLSLCYEIRKFTMKTASVEASM